MALSQDDKDILFEYARKLELDADVLPAFDAPQPGIDWYVEYALDTYDIKYLEHGYVVYAHSSTKSRDEFLLEIFTSIAQTKALKHAYAHSPVDRDPYRLYHAKLKEYLGLLNPAWEKKAENIRQDDLDQQGYDDFITLRNQYMEEIAANGQAAKSAILSGRYKGKEPMRPDLIERYARDFAMERYPVTPAWPDDFRASGDIVSALPQDVIDTIEGYVQELGLTRDGVLTYDVPEPWYIPCAQYADGIYHYLVCGERGDDDRRRTEDRQEFLFWVMYRLTEYHTINLPELANEDFAVTKRMAHERQQEMMGRIDPAWQQRVAKIHQEENRDA